MRALAVLTLLLLACGETTPKRERDADLDASGDAGPDPSDGDAGDAGDAAMHGGDAGPPPDYEVCGTTRTAGLDLDCDGEPDRLCRIYVGPQGEDVRSDALTAYDDDCDGRPDRKCIVSHWDEFERREHVELDDACDGRPASCSNTTYAEDGIELDYRREYMCDVRYLGIESCRSAEYDVETRTARYTDDDTCDGSSESCTIMTFNEQGETVSVEVRDESCDGPALRCAGQERDGMVVTGRIDEGCDEAFEVCQRLEYTTDGRPFTEEVDSRCNGPSPDDTCLTFEWSDEEHAIITVDTGCDGTIDTCTGSMARYDDEGRMIARDTYDSSFIPGCEQPITCSTFEYDDDGKLVAQTLDFRCDGKLDGDRDTCTTWLYSGSTLLAEIADVRCDQTECTTLRFEESEACF
jgi:hypothetical protein